MLVTIETSKHIVFHTLTVDIYQSYSDGTPLRLKARSNDLRWKHFLVYPRGHVLRELSLSNYYSQVCLVWVNAPCSWTPFLDGFALSAPESQHYVFPSRKAMSCLNKAVISEVRTFLLSDTLRCWNTALKLQQPCTFNGERRRLVWALGLTSSTLDCTC